MKNIGNFIYNNNSNKLFFEKFINFIKTIEFTDKSKIYYREDKKFIFSVVSDKIIKIIYMILSIIKNKVILKTFLKKYLPEKYIFSKDAALKKFRNLKKSEINEIISRLNKLHKNKIKIKNTKISESVFKLERI